MLASVFSPQMCSLFSHLGHFPANFPRTRVILGKQELGVTDQAAALLASLGDSSAPPLPLAKVSES